MIVEEHVPQMADDHLVAGRRDGKDDHRRADEDVQLEVVDEGRDLNGEKGYDCKKTKTKNIKRKTNLLTLRLLPRQRSSSSNSLRPQRQLLSGPRT